MSLGTAGTGGFAILNDGLASYSTYAQIVVGIFMMLFGINFNIYYWILIGKFKLIFKNEELRWYLIIIGIATAIITVNVFTSNYYDSAFVALKNAFFQTSSIITTTGYGITDINAWPILSKVVLFILMFIGGSAGSTAGGIKVTRFVILIKSLKREVDKLVHPNSVAPIVVDGEIIDEGVVRSVNSYFGLMFILFFVGVFIVSINGKDFETTISAVATCLNNVGPGFGQAASNMTCFNGFTKIVLSIIMLIGRLEIYPILLLFMPKIWSRK